MYPTLKTYIDRYVKLNSAEYELLEPFLKFRKIKKKEYLLKEGQICNARYFILKGCFRSYYIDDNGTEKVIHFGVENWWMTDYDSLTTQKSSHLNIQAIEDSEVLVLDTNSFENLCVKLPKMERFFRIIAERTFVASQRRIHYMFSYTGEEMYTIFSETFPNFVQRVPQYMLASYLGITPEFLSKIKASKFK